MTADICCHITVIRHLTYNLSDVCCHITVIRRLILYVMLYNCYQTSDVRYPLSCHSIDVPNTRDQILSDQRRSKLLSVNSIHPYKWKSKRMPATYLRCMHNNNLKTKIAATLVARNKSG